MSFSRTKPSIVPFSKEQLLNSFQQELTTDEEFLMMDYLLKMEFPILRQKKLLRRGYENNQCGGSFENEKRAVELIMKLDPTLPLPTIKGIYPSIKTIIYVNKFENGISKHWLKI